jgi:hypothetical protein
MKKLINVFVLILALISFGCFTTRALPPEIVIDPGGGGTDTGGTLTNPVIVNNLNGSYDGYLSSPTDIDYFKVVLPAGAFLKVYSTQYTETARIKCKYNYYTYDDLLQYKYDNYSASDYNFEFEEVELFGGNEYVFQVQAADGVSTGQYKVNFEVYTLISTDVDVELFNEGTTLLFGDYKTIYYIDNGDDVLDLNTDKMFISLGNAIGGEPVLISSSIFHCVSDVYGKYCELDEDVSELDIFLSYDSTGYTSIGKHLFIPYLGSVEINNNDDHLFFTKIGSLPFSSIDFYRLFDDDGDPVFLVDQETELYSYVEVNNEYYIVSEYNWGDYGLGTYIMEDYTHLNYFLDFELGYISIWTVSIINPFDQSYTSNNLPSGLTVILIQ